MNIHPSQAAPAYGDCAGGFAPPVTATAWDALAPKFLTDFVFVFQPDETKYAIEAALVQAKPSKVSDVRFDSHRPLHKF